MFWPILVVLFMFGAVFGSFLNVCIYRLPRDESLIWTRSYCPECESKIAWYDNIPLFSFLFLGGKCRQCGRRISGRYFIVELLSGSIVAGCGFWWLRPPQLAWFNFFCLSFLLLVSLAIFFIDFEFSIIPNELNYSLLLFGVCASFFSHYPLSKAPLGFNPAQIKVSLLGMVVGGGLFLFLALISPLIYGQSALGMGDVKLIAGYGSWLGIEGALFVIIFGSLLGAIVGSTVMFFQNRSLREEIPFGPFLCLAAAVYLLCGPLLVQWYLGLFQPAL